LLGFLIENDNLLPGVDELRCRDEAGKSRSNDDHVGIISHFSLAEAETH
jgi:hypothetical protein